MRPVAAVLGEAIAMVSVAVAQVVVLDLQAVVLSQLHPEIAVALVYWEKECEAVEVVA